MDNMETITVLIGLTPTAIEITEDSIQFAFDDGSSCEFYHAQDCCESVYIEDVNGDWNDLIGHPLLVAEQRESRDEEGADVYDSTTWTFYTFRCNGGSVDVRWCGTSNGYYSEAVDFRFDEAPEFVPPTPDPEPIKTGTFTGHDSK